MYRTENTFVSYSMTWREHVTYFKSNTQKCLFYQFLMTQIAQMALCTVFIITYSVGG